jgi:inhibitor of KinA
MQDAPWFQVASDQSLLIYFGHEINADAHRRVVKLQRLFEVKPIAGVRNLHPAYCSLLVNFDALQYSHEQIEEILRSYLDRIEKIDLPDPRMVEIPVCYGGEYGPDLYSVAAKHEVSPEQVIDLQASATYVVYFLGFVPGFAYLGGLPEKLATPRLATPRKIVQPGSLGIAGNQAGVYPFGTPGGWNLIGRTPLAIFQPGRRDMSLLSIGDSVRFTPISQERFATWV